MNKSPIQQAVDAAGSQASLAKAIGITQPMIWQWCAGRRPVAARRCLAIEAATKNKVTRYDLRPDIFGTPPTSRQEMKK